MHRKLFLAAAMATLSGCHLVGSDRPMFTGAEGEAGPALKPGLWAVVEPGCKFNTSSSPQKWPACATPVVLGDGSARDGRAAADGPMAVTVAGGDPVIVQAQSSEPGAARFAFLGLRPLAMDSAGYVSRARVWPALCDDPRGRPGRLPTGLVPTRSGDCMARAPGPVRRAVAQSEAWSFQGDSEDAGRVAYWLRPR